MRRGFTDLTISSIHSDPFPAFGACFVLSMTE